ncbi:DUF321 domain-containing protein [Mesorhizobium sp. M00.F.Ca.ET.186.01.1.1]|nr:DUF321 domain-containing protein [Mesorhizobium sp. M00.F.Ca.ET.186.01.1.1]
MAAFLLTQSRENDNQRLRFWRENHGLFLSDLQWTRFSLASLPTMLHAACGCRPSVRLLRRL